jgi:hypothetical protein
MKKLQSPITPTRITLALAAVLATFAQGVHAQLNEEQLTPLRTSRFAAETAFPYYTSDPYGRNPSRVFPDDPANFFEHRKAARTLVQAGDCASAERLLVRLEGADPNVKHLIVDLRHNSGGNDYLTNRLLRALIQFDMNPDKGQLYVLIGRGTYSAAQIFVTRLEALSNAVFVGEPTSSRPTFIGRTGRFTLPYSGLSGFISSELSQSSWPEDHRIWIAPDMPVGLSSRDFFSGRDPALEAVLKIVADDS